jgi:hypothetical protein
MKRTANKPSNCICHFSRAQLGRVRAAARSCGVTAETFARNVIIAAVRSIERERRP